MVTVLSGTTQSRDTSLTSQQRKRDFLSTEVGRIGVFRLPMKPAWSARDVCPLRHRRGDVLQSGATNICFISSSSSTIYFKISGFCFCFCFLFFQATLVAAEPRAWPVTSVPTLLTW